MGIRQRFPKFSSLTITTSLIAFGGVWLLAQASHSAHANEPKNFGSIASVAGSSQSSRLAADFRPASATLKLGLQAIDQKNMTGALAARDKLKPGTLERKVLAWAIALNGKKVPPETLINIASDLPGWPGQKTMRRSIELAFADADDGRSLSVALAGERPQTVEAAIVLARHYMRKGKPKLAHKAVAAYWRGYLLTSTIEKKIRQAAGSSLTREDHRARLEYLLSRRRLTSAARLAGDAGATRMTKARIAAERDQRNASSAIEAIPSFQKKDPNTLVTRAIYLRKQERLTQAANVLLSVRPADIHPNAADYTYRQQRIVASDLVEAGKVSLAYKLANRNVALSSRAKIDAEFYAGWLALRKLRKPEAAETHFRALLKLASTPLSLTRGYYWLGRALEARGQKSAAQESFGKAARHDSTYYGQLAAKRIGRKSIKVSRPSPNKGDRKRFPSYELVQAIGKLESAGHHRRASLIYRHLGYALKSPGEVALLAARAEKKGEHSTALRVGKSAFSRGLQVDTVAWPLGAIPRSVKTGKAGLPLVYAISRQESTFQIDARSSANALGLMQLIPSTAKNTARKMGLPYSKSRLVRDAAYNARLGSYYLGQQIERFNGSLILSFIAYNAGPLRSEEWIKRFGDPRGKSLDYVIDWVEQIPYSETRNYVQRVMENLQVYKARLEGSSLTIEQDLRRGRAG